MKNIAVILAGGVGSRFGIASPKQFLKIAGQTVIEHTVDVFQKHSQIDEIVVVIHNNYLHIIEAMTVKNNWTKVKKILIGGNERYESSLAAIKAYNDEKSDINLIFHDAVRPFVNAKIINDVIDALKEYNAVDTAIPSADTIIQLKENEREILAIPSRKYLYRGQTPQAFKLSVIKKAYEVGLKDTNFQVTDDCGVVLKYLPDEPICIVRGGEFNVKLTYPEDAHLFDKIFQIKCGIINENLSMGLLRDKVLVVFGGSSGIGENIIDIAIRYGVKTYKFSRRLNNTDIVNFDSVKNALSDVIRKEGRIDYVVNSAAILNKGPILNLTLNEVYEIIDINYKGMVNVTIASAEYLKMSKGQILHFTSSSYTRGRAMYAMYSSTKAAIVNFVQAVAEEWKDCGVRINCINPERTKTPMREKNFGIEDEKTLLCSEHVAKISLMTLLNEHSGEIIDIKI